MQDLEEIRKKVDADEPLTSRELVNLIARCESAEKELAAANRIGGAMAAELGKVVELCGGDENDLAAFAVRDVISQRDSALAELKELREQKPVAEVEHSDFITAEELVNGLPRKIAVKQLFNGALKFGDKLYAAPVAQSRDSAEPADHVLMPKSLTAENGAKSLFMGEFNEQVEMTCPECADCDDEEDHCIICNGSGQYIQKVPVSWSTIKDIYAMAVSKLSSPQSNANAHSEQLDFVIAERDGYRESRDKLIEKCESLEIKIKEMQKQSPAVAVPDGYALIPTEPTDEMIEAFNKGFNKYNEHSYFDYGAYEAMLSAAPQASAEQKAESEYKNCIGVKRIGDQSVQLVFASCRSASKFERYVKSAQDEGKV
jgi:hypothetical protein